MGLFPFPSCPSCPHFVFVTQLVIRRYVYFPINIIIIIFIQELHFYQVHSSSSFDTCLDKNRESPLCYSGRIPLYMSNGCIDLPIPCGELFPGDIQEHCLYLHMPEPSNRTWGIVTHCQNVPIENSILR